MSGHSKWATTKRAKGATDAKRAVIFTKLAKAITVAAKAGGSDPGTNFKLRLAVDQAKGANMPKENIERAIKRGTGELGGGVIEQVSYEGFGPEGVAFIIDCLTDNRNRTSANIKHLFGKYGGNLGGPNSVSWLFEPRGIILIKNLPEDLELELIDAGAQDIWRETEGVTIYTQPGDLQKIKEFLEKKSLIAESAEVQQVAKEKKTVSSEIKEKLEKFFEDLENDEDVNNYYTNAEI